MELVNEGGGTGGIIIIESPRDVHGVASTRPHSPTNYPPLGLPIHPSMLNCYSWYLQYKKFENQKKKKK